MKSCIIIPARLNSSRLPEKVLLPIGGKPMVQWVYERALKVSNVHKVIIATDHPTVYDACIGFGAEVMMTSPNHVSGTDRVGEVVRAYPGYDFYINIQGDEPLIDPAMLSDFNVFLQSGQYDICTVCEKVKNEADLFDFNVVKLVKSKSQSVLYFSRNAIPAHRDKPYKDWSKSHDYYRHVGIYGFSESAINKVVNLPVSPLEHAESLEQLRWMENDFKIGVMESNSYSIGVDTLDDLEKVRKMVDKLS
jgi:3-deoxy-manno-octulosonate cytidylyltransferase (CMP-KDO synthetase)